MSAAVNQTSPQAVLDRLNRFEQENPVVGDPGQAPNVWDHFIPNLDGYNEFASMAIDPKDRGDRFIVNFHDRQVTYRLTHQGDGWYIAADVAHTARSIR